MGNTRSLACCVWRPRQTLPAGSSAPQFQSARAPTGAAKGAAALPYKILHGLWGMGQMMFTKYLVVVDEDLDVDAEVKVKVEKPFKR